MPSKTNIEDPIEMLYIESSSLSLPEFRKRLHILVDLAVSGVVERIATETISNDEVHLLNDTVIVNRLINVLQSLKQTPEPNKEGKDEQT